MTPPKSDELAPCPKLGVSGILTVDGKYLLGKRLPNDTQGGKWVTAGGGVEFQENLCDALVREYEEETGLTVFPKGGFLSVQQRIGNGKHVVMVFFEVGCNNPAAAFPSDGFSDIDWFSWEQIQEMRESGTVTEMTWNAIWEHHTRHSPTPPLPESKGGDVQMMPDGYHEVTDIKGNKQLTSPEQQQPSRGSNPGDLLKEALKDCRPTPLPEGLAKAIEDTEGLIITFENVGHNCRAKNLKVLVSAAKQSRELMEQLNQNKLWSQQLYIDRDRAEQQSLAQRELIEKLVEALNKNKVDEHVVNCPDCIQALSFNLSTYANGKLKLNLCDEHRRLVVAAVNSRTEALSLARSLGFGKKD